MSNIKTTIAVPEITPVETESTTSKDMVKAFSSFIQTCIAPTLVNGLKAKGVTITVADICKMLDVSAPTTPMLPPISGPNIPMNLQVPPPSKPRSTTKSGAKTRGKGNRSKVLQEHIDAKKGTGKCAYYIAHSKNGPHFCDKNVGPNGYFCNSCGSNRVGPKEYLANLKKSDPVPQGYSSSRASRPPLKTFKEGRVKQAVSADGVILPNYWNVDGKFILDRESENIVYFTNDKGDTVEVSNFDETVWDAVKKSDLGDYLPDDQTGKFQEYINKKSSTSQTSTPMMAMPPIPGTGVGGMPELPGLNTSLGPLSLPPLPGVATPTPSTPSLPPLPGVSSPASGTTVLPNIGNFDM